MQKSVEEPRPRRSPPRVRECEQPLLALLVQEAAKRGDTLTQMAAALGVTYRRVAQWRRNEAYIKNAGRGVFQSAAKYLGLPVIWVLLHAEEVSLSDFDWPHSASLEDVVKREMERVRRDPVLGPLVPGSLMAANRSVRLFVVFLFHELERVTHTGKSYAQWLEELRSAASTDGP